MPNPPPAAPEWYQVVVQVHPLALEAAGWFFLERSEAGFELVDHSHPSPPRDLPPGFTEIRAPFRGSAQAGLVLADLEEFLEFARGNLPADAWRPPRVLRLADEEWSESWRRHIQPTRVGRFFIHPDWIRPDPGDSVALCLNPGMAFGTGLHPTTRLCLQEMDPHLPATGFLDVGCGSGILALAAALAGSTGVVAVDLDPQAVRIARQNARLNRLGKRVRVVRGGPQDVPGRYSLVVANILSETLVRLAPALIAKLEPQGILLLSGLLADETGAVLHVFQQAGCRAVATRAEQEWRLLAMRNSGRSQ